MSAIPNILDAPFRLPRLRRRLTKLFKVELGTFESDPHIREIVERVHHVKKGVNKKELLKKFTGKVHFHTLHVLIKWICDGHIDTPTMRQLNFIDSVNTLYPECFFYKDEPVPSNQCVFETYNPRSLEIGRVKLPLTGDGNYFIVEGTQQARLKLCWIYEKMDSHSRHILSKSEIPHLVFPAGTHVNDDKIRTIMKVELVRTVDLYQFQTYGWLKATTFVEMDPSIVMYIPRWFMVDVSNRQIHHSTMCPQTTSLAKSHNITECKWYINIK